MFETSRAESFEVPEGGGKRKFSVGNRILWRDPFGIAGFSIAARIEAVTVFDRGDPCVVCLRVEPSEVVRAVEDWVRESWLRESYAREGSPRHMFGDGRPVFVTGEAFMRASWMGKLRPAAEEEQGRAQDEKELSALPDWWATRREDFERMLEEDA